MIAAGSQKHEQEREIFLQASEIHRAEQRASFLDQACGGDTTMRARVERMLQAQDEAGEFFKPFETGESPSTRIVTGAADPQEGPGSELGCYRLLEKIGEGGFGTVYMAEQLHPVKRKVALKIIKLGMDTREVIARFEAERQALALMDHPNVARVLDAGMTASGRPYFVLELVRGLPINEFCDRNKLDTAERIELIMQVCHAAQHAHSKGIIHRDLKPSNILISSQDGRALPKVIDFGIAKAIQGSLTDQTLFTRFGQMVGTPVYMSPEHLDGVDVDTRSDIYSIGVILYELLTGKPPFDLQRLQASGSTNMLRVIREEDPPPPSTRVTTLGSELPQIAEHRQVNGRRLRELLRGDLDWITMKALQKDRTRRYATPSALAEELQRYLSHQPVLAGPPSPVYRLSKFVERHRLGVTVSLGIFVALVLGLVLATYGFLNVRSERERALGAERIAEHQRGLTEIEAQRAKAEETRARQISYDSDMALASHALELNNLGRVRSLLSRHLPQAGVPDLRRWEWRYLWQQCQSQELFQLGVLSNSVLSLSLSGDGSLLAAGDLDGMVAVWDVPARLRLWSSNANPILAISPDGKLIADGGGVLRDAESGRIQRSFTGAWPIKKLTFSPNERLLAATTGTDGLTLWDARTWAPIGSYKNFPSSGLHTRALAFSREQDWIAVGTQDGRVQIADVRTGELIRSWKAHAEPVTALAVSQDSRLIATASGYSDTTVVIWSATDGTEDSVLKGHRAWVSSLAFSPDGKLLASASADQNICLWDVAERQLFATLKGHLHEVWTVAFSPDGKSVISGGKDGAIKVWRVPARTRPMPVVTFKPRDLELLPDTPRDFSFTTDGSEALCADELGWVTRWTLPSLRLVGRIEALGMNNYALASSSSAGLLAAADEQGRVKVWDQRAQAIDAQWTVCSLTNHITGLAFTEGGRRLVSVTDYMRVDVWDSATGKAMVNWSSGEKALRPVSVSPDGRFLASGGRNLRVYELATGRLVVDLYAHKYSTDAVAFSPTGSLLVSGSQEGLAKLWRTDTWQPAGTLTGHLLGVHSVAFSTDGTRVATGSLGGEAVKLWDVATAQEVLNLSSTRDQVFWLTFAPGGQSLVALGVNSGLKCWSAPPSDRIEKP